MKQLIQSYRTGELWLADVPAPAVAPGGVLVQTASSLVSAGTERMIVQLAKKSLLGKARARPDLVRQVIAKIKTEGLSVTMGKVFTKLDAPFALGYSSAGTVVEVGAKVTNLRVGDRVACAGAGYATHAEHNFIPKNLCAKIPDGVSFEDAAFATVGAIAMQGVRQAEPRLGERVAVIGLGLLGLLTVQMLKAAGCIVIGSDLDASKCELAKALGADEATTSGLADLVAARTEGHGADAVIITAATPSNRPIEVAADICRTKGRVVVVGLVGMDVPRDPFYKKELDLRLSMSYGPGRYDAAYEEGGIDYPYAYVRWTEQRNMASFLELVAAGRVTPSKLVTHRYTIDDALQAYEMLEGKADGESKPNYLGIILNYPQPDTAAPPQRKVALRQPKATGAGERVGIALMGGGNFARSVLLPAIKRSGHAELLGICTATGMSGTSTGRKHDFEYATTDWQDVLKDQRVQAVVIATPHDQHAALACDALAAGKHVFVEKPLAIHEEQVEQYERTVRNLGEQGPCLMVGFNRRFSPHAVALRDAFARRSTPLVVNYRVNAGVVPPDHWLQNPDIGGGRIVGEVCHFVDLCEYVIHAQPQRVFAMSVQSDDSRIVPEDSAVITISYADGSLATIQYLAHGSSQVAKERIEACADGITALSDNFRRTDFHGKRLPAVKGRQDKGFDAEIQAFLNTARHGGDWPIPFASMMRTTRLTFAIRQSLRTGEAVDVN